MACVCQLCVCERVTARCVRKRVCVSVSTVSVTSVTDVRACVCISVSVYVAVCAVREPVRARMYV